MSNRLVFSCFLSAVECERRAVDARSDVSMMWMRMSLEKISCLLYAALKPTLLDSQSQASADEPKC